MKYDKALDAIRSRLTPGEQILAATSSGMLSAQGNWLKGALVVTDRQILFTGSMGFGSQNTSIPLQTVTSIDEHKQALKKPQARIAAAGAVHHFLDPGAEWFAAANAARHDALFSVVQPTPPTQSTPAPASPGIADQLAQLEQLRASGVLSDDEFATAKARVLSA